MRNVHKLHITQFVSMLDENSALRPNMPQATPHQQDANPQRTPPHTTHTVGSPHTAGDGHRPDDAHDAMPQCVGVPQTKTDSRRDEHFRVDDGRCRFSASLPLDETRHDLYVCMVW